MLLKVFSIKDAKTGIFHTPWYKKTHGEAERDFRALVNDDKSFINKFPEDYDLWYLGDYDDNTGKMESLDTPNHVIKAVQCLSTEEKLRAIQ